MRCRNSRTSATCAGSLECDAHANARSCRVSPKRSTTPARASGIAWNGLAAERQKVLYAESPAWATSFPLASTTATWTRWRDSRTVPRIDSTNNQAPFARRLIADCGFRTAECNGQRQGARPLIANPQSAIVNPQLHCPAMRTALLLLLLLPAGAAIRCVKQAPATRHTPAARG